MFIRSLVNNKTLPTCRNADHKKYRPQKSVDVFLFADNGINKQLPSPSFIPFKFCDIIVEEKESSVTIESFELIPPKEGIIMVSPRVGTTTTTTTTPAKKSKRAQASSSSSSSTTNNYVLLFVKLMLVIIILLWLPQLVTSRRSSRKKKLLKTLKKHTHRNRLECEVECLDELLPEEAMNCIYQCWSIDCYQQIYGGPSSFPLEPGEIDLERASMMEKCVRTELAEERRRKKTQPRTPQTTEEEEKGDKTMTKAIMDPPPEM